MFDYLILICVLILVTLGVLFIYSSSINSEGVSVTNEYIKQIIWAGVGLLLMIVISLYDYKHYERISFWAYAFMILVLIYTRIFGRVVNGARSWIGIGDFGIQPSEFSKVFLRLALAKYLDENKNENPLKKFIFATVIMCIPMGLILIQPDMGTASVYIPIFLVMCFMAGIPLRFLMFVLLFGLGTIFFAILPVWNEYIAVTSHPAISILTTSKLRFLLIGATTSITLISVVVRRYLHGKKYFYWIAYFFLIISLALFCSTFLSKFLKGYQIMRLIIFLNPDVDPLGSGWNIIQSKIAIGSGSYFGRGYLGGTQSHYRFLPQQSTDFIFSILSEEFGFFGGLLVFSLYFVILIRILLIMRKVNNLYGTYITAGILAMFSFHFFINVGMVMGIMPITGIPLLFMSYGGSSLLTAMSCMGILMNINARKKDLH